MKTYNKDPDAESLLMPEEYRVTPQDGTEQLFGDNTHTGQRGGR